MARDEQHVIRVILLSAPRGAGKTTACQRFVEHARAAGMRVGGVMAPARLNAQGQKIGFDVLEAHTQERIPLGVWVANPDQATIGHYRMDEEVLDWAVQRVLVALDAPIDVVVIDEIGPLELFRGGGFWIAVERLAAARATLAIFLVRAELLSRLQNYLSPFKPSVVLLSLANRDQIPLRLFEQVWELVTKRWDEP